MISQKKVSLSTSVSCPCVQRCGPAGVFTFGILAVLRGGNGKMYDGALRGGVVDLSILTDTSDDRGLVH